MAVNHSIWIMNFSCRPTLRDNWNNKSKVSRSVDCCFNSERNYFELDSEQCAIQFFSYVLQYQVESLVISNFFDQHVWFIHCFHKIPPSERYSLLFSMTSGHSFYDSTILVLQISRDHDEKYFSRGWISTVYIRKLFPACRKSIGVKMSTKSVVPTYYY